MLWLEQRPGAELTHQLVVTLLLPVSSSVPSSLLEKCRAAGPCSCAAQAVLPKDTSALVRLTLGRRPLGEAVAVPGPGPLLAAQALGPLSPEDRKDHARRVWHPGVSWLQEPAVVLAPKLLEAGQVQSCQPAVVLAPKLLEAGQVRSCQPAVVLAPKLLEAGQVRSSQPAVVLAPKLLEAGQVRSCPLCHRHCPLQLSEMLEYRGCGPQPITVAGGGQGHTAGPASCEAYGASLGVGTWAMVAVRLGLSAPSSGRPLLARAPQASAQDALHPSNFQSLCCLNNETWFLPSDRRSRACKGWLAEAAVPHGELTRRSVRPAGRAAEALDGADACMLTADSRCCTADSHMANWRRQCGHSCAGRAGGVPPFPSYTSVFWPEASETLTVPPCALGELRHGRRVWGVATAGLSGHAVCSGSLGQLGSPSKRVENQNQRCRVRENAGARSAGPARGSGSGALADGQLRISEKHLRVARCSASGRLAKRSGPAVSARPRTAVSVHLGRGNAGCRRGAWTTTSALASGGRASELGPAGHASRRDGFLRDAGFHSASSHGGTRITDSCGVPVSGHAVVPLRCGAGARASAPPPCDSAGPGVGPPRRGADGVPERSRGADVDAS
ncbi:unnamed protein product [Rangifer tarandus platyrhynchus]|uniref:Uncharacterized protein n=1 Tax=Rangifer tarandus platyrhynchus TaxID=3082113 RepID=A0ABN8Z8D5_RANTA|nr:unnamed protein product [Rangifer tarandus platyrhynchus]